MQNSVKVRKRIPRQEIQRRVVEGLDKSFDRGTNLTLYLRACERLLREGQSAQAEHDYEQAYFIMLRLVELLVTYIPRHPHAKDQEYAAKIRKFSKQVPLLLTNLDKLKSQVDAEYERYQRQQQAVVENQAKLDMAIRAKRKEIESAQAFQIDQVKVPASHKPDLSGIRERLDALGLKQPVMPISKDDSSVLKSNDRYDYPALQPVSSVNPYATSPTLDHLHGPITTAPPRPPKLTSVSEVEKMSSDTSSAQVSEHHFASHAILESGEPLKTLFVPSSLRSAFLKLAQKNTAKNLETCGILSGVLRNNAYFVTTLIVPAQDSTSDTCHTTDEEALFTYQDTHDLFTLGWIHTHPTQTCFLSSVDLHTQCSYQLMLPESVAIVCAPSKTPNWGVFRLTDPPGLPVVRNCRQDGLFHPHAEDHIYVAAGKDTAGHVRELEGMTFTIKDQRKQ